MQAPPAGTPTPPGTAVAQRALCRGSRGALPLRRLRPQDRAVCRSGPTRLETRTKESDMGASSRVANPSAQRNRDSLSL